MWNKAFNVKTIGLIYCIFTAVFCIALYGIKDLRYNANMDLPNQEDYMQCGSISLLVQSIEPELVAKGYSKDLFDNYPEPKFIDPCLYKLEWESGDYLTLFIEDGILHGYDMNNYYRYFE